MDLKYLEKASKYWQGIIGLRDWVVVVKQVRLGDMDGMNIAGDVLIHAEQRRALIRIVDPEELGEELLPRLCGEQVLLHELLHIHFDGFNTEAGTPQRLCEEQAIHALMEALWRQRR